MAGQLPSKADCTVGARRASGPDKQAVIRAVQPATLCSSSSSSSLVVLREAAPQTQGAQKCVPSGRSVHQLLVLPALRLGLAGWVDAWVGGGTGCGQRAAWLRRGLERGTRQQSAWRRATAGICTVCRPTVAAAVIFLGGRSPAPRPAISCLLLVAIIGQQAGAGQPGGARGLERVLLRLLNIGGKSTEGLATSEDNLAACIQVMWQHTLPSAGPLSCVLPC